MKRFLLLPLCLLLIIGACAKKYQLKKGSAAYTFAKELSTKLPYLDPDANNPLVTTKVYRITTGEVLEEIFTTYGKEAEQLKSMNAEQIKFQVNQAAVDLGERKLLLNEAEKINVKVTEVQLDSIMELQYKEKGGKDRFNEYILNLGIGLEVVKRDLRNQMLIDQFFTSHFEKDLAVSESEIQTVYNQGTAATVRHLLLLTKDKNDAAKKTVYRTMEALLTRARKGEDFIALIRRYSEYPGAAKDGGLVSDIARGDMVASFDSAAFATPIGGISGIFETEHGYHILKVIERKKDPRPLDLVRADIQMQAEKRKRNELYPKIREYVDRLKQDNAFAVVSF